MTHIKNDKLEKSPSPVYGARLELVYGLIAHRGFESLLLRQAYENHRKYGGFLFCTRFLHDCSYILNKISRLRPIKVQDGCLNYCRSMLSAHILSILIFYPIVINPDTERLHAILFSIESASIFRRNIRRINVHRHSPFAKKFIKPLANSKEL